MEKHKIKKMVQLQQLKLKNKQKDPSPIIGTEVPLAVETNFCEEGLRGETCLESNVI